MLFSHPWGGFSDFQDDSAIDVEPVREMARTNGANQWSGNGPETVLFSSRRVGTGDVHSR
jgi:hypothetical protein